MYMKTLSIKFPIRIKHRKRLFAIFQEIGLFKKETENRFALSRVKLGIDLRGGTYITLGVEIEKALENRLGNESRALDNLFKKKLPTKPLKKEIKNSTISITFDDEETAKICYNLMRTEILSLRTARDEKTVTATLTPAEDTKIRTESVDQALQVISNRLMGLGVEGIVVQKHGTATTSREELVRVLKEWGEGRL